METPRRTDRATRVIAAAPASLFAAMLDPAALETWLAPPGSYLEIKEFQPVDGGVFRSVLTFTGASGKTGPNTDEVTGRFVEIVPPARLIQEVDFVSEDPAFAGTMRMRWSLRPAASGTEVTVVAEDVPPGIRPEDHAAGLAASLENLARFLET